MSADTSPAEATVPPTSEEAASPAPVVMDPDPLDDLKDIDFLMEDIEDQIAPLALAH